MYIKIDIFFVFTLLNTHYKTKLIEVIQSLFKNHIHIQLNFKRRFIKSYIAYIEALLCFVYCLNVCKYFIMKYWLICFLQYIWVTFTKSPT